MFECQRDPSCAPFPHRLLVGRRGIDFVENEYDLVQRESSNVIEIEDRRWESVVEKTQINQDLGPGSSHHHHHCRNRQASYFCCCLCWTDMGCVHGCGWGLDSAAGLTVTVVDSRVELSTQQRVHRLVPGRVNWIWSSWLTITPATRARRRMWCEEGGGGCCCCCCQYQRGGVSYVRDLAGGRHPNQNKFGLAGGRRTWGVPDERHHARPLDVRPRESDRPARCSR